MFDMRLTKRMELLMRMSNETDVTTVITEILFLYLYNYLII